MKNENILIIGAKGQLGKALQLKYPGATTVDSDTLDITDRMALKIFEWFNVRVIINAAAYTNVDRAETPEGRIAAWKVNALATSFLTDIAIEHGITLIHISTDYVFDGTNE